MSPRPPRAGTGSPTCLVRCGPGLDLHPILPLLPVKERVTGPLSLHLRIWEMEVPGSLTPKEDAVTYGGPCWDRALSGASMAPNAGPQALQMASSLLPGPHP